MCLLTETKVPKLEILRYSLITSFDYDTEGKKFQFSIAGISMMPQDKKLMLEKAVLITNTKGILLSLEELKTLLICVFSNNIAGRAESIRLDGAPLNAWKSIIEDVKKFSEIRDKADLLQAFQ